MLMQVIGLLEPSALAYCKSSCLWWL